MSGKRIVITGGGSGIGRATALLCGAAGARVAVVDVDEASAEEAARLVRAAGAEALGVAADVSREDDVERAIKTAVDAWGGLDVAVANAGIELDDEDGRAHELELGVWQRTLDVNLTGAFLTCKHALRAMLRGGAGAIVCMASPTGLYGCAPSLSAYSASKAGVYGLIRVLAAGYASDGIRVNGVMPGYTRTPMAASMTQREIDETLATIPLQRAAEADEVAEVIAFLASDAARYVTGAVWAVDGGMTAI